jgi:hypothetical protein
VRRRRGGRVRMPGEAIGMSGVRVTERKRGRKKKKVSVELGDGLDIVAFESDSPSFFAGAMWS